MSARMIKTKVDSELADAELQHSNDPERAELIARTRRFKASWLELAEALTHVRKNDTWKNWGFESFEQYGARELKLRQETVDKLTGSYAFLQRRAPSVLKRDGVIDAIPSYQAVDFLRRVEEKEDAPEEAVVAIRKKVLEDGVPLPSVSREYKDVVFPIDDDTRDKRDKVALRHAAHKLKDALASTRAVPKHLANGVTEKLDELLEALVDAKKRAA
jgi:lipopolysaccharide biosynthesis regulator YciM